MKSRANTRLPVEIKISLRSTKNSVCHSVPVSRPLPFCPGSRGILYYDARLNRFPIHKRIPFYYGTGKEDLNIVYYFQFTSLKLPSDRRHLQPLNNVPATSLYLSLFLRDTNFFLIFLPVRHLRPFVAASKRIFIIREQTNLPSLRFFRLASITLRSPIIVPLLCSLRNPPGCEPPFSSDSHGLCPNRVIVYDSTELSLLVRDPFRVARAHLSVERVKERAREALLRAIP